MRPALLLSLPAIMLFAVSTAAAAEWKAVEKVVTYPIAGSTGMELYQSIGENGPVIGNGVRTIAHTSFKLLWSRDYQPRGTACVLVSARPSLTITYTLPKPRQTLSPAMKTRWDRFLAGIRTHEAVHGENIRGLVRSIEQASVGLTVENDPGCRKIRDELQARLKVLSDARLRKESDFDRVEMGPGGNVQHLILDLVNE